MQLKWPRAATSAASAPPEASRNLNDPNWGRGGSDQPPQNPDPKNGNGTGQGDKRPGQDGKRPGQGSGPPDLDELWRDFNRKLNGLFGRKGRGGGSFKPPRRPDFQTSPKIAGLGLIILVVVLVLAWLGSGFFIVQEGQQAVVTRFGKLAYIEEAGFHWRLPYPIESEEIVNVSQVRSVEIGRGGEIRTTGLPASAMLTEDENIVDIRFAVQYRISNVVDYLYNNRSPDDVVTQAAETAIRSVVGSKTLDYVLYEGRGEVATKVQDLIQSILDRYKTGILVTNVTLQSVQPPEQVQAAFNDAIKAGQDRERLKNEAEAYANDVVPRAKGTASRLVQEAEGYKARVVAQAQGDTSRFDLILNQYEKAPQVTRERMYLETMQQILSNVSKVMVDSHGSNNLLYLPLDKLLQQSALPAPAPSGRPAASALPVPSLPAASAPALADSTAGVAASTPLANASGSSSRDTLRERDSR
ncbi:MAG: FtsH protease activity modulator HflK [Betaproteobacteria bacterium]|nr:FtsH protease activity modulator HflK [Betaproteobacteria bacterium]